MHNDLEATFNQPFIGKAKWVILATSCWVGISSFYSFDTGVTLGVQPFELLMIVFRVVFGTRLEAVMVCRASILTRWYSGDSIKATSLL
mmetsp:Transcript_16529/g.26854  ORF Transcript_16529/g.26854 Transcript_16529/m.26854 type:complete len:89 (-) Transcript_16529:254-520(-)